MREIHKDQEPHHLTEHRTSQYCDYYNYPYKDDLRSALVNEQGSLCCYCMGRIKADPLKMKIEHWKCREDFPTEQLNYKNLLGACLGNQGLPPNMQHCDTRKGRAMLLYNPADPTHHIESRIRYLENGEILSNESTFNDQLNDVLNLNLPILKNGRKSVVIAMADWLKRQSQPVPRQVIEIEIFRLKNQAGKLNPYSQVAIWWLSEQLR